MPLLNNILSYTETCSYYSLGNVLLYICKRDLDVLKNIFPKSGSYKTVLISLMRVIYETPERNVSAKTRARLPNSLPIS